jgi:hypothetical protein
MAAQTRVNLYPGVNPHLNSFLQQEGGGWESFHAELIAAMRAWLDETLPPNYYAVAEKSLQISEKGLSAERAPLRRRDPDVSVFRRPEATPPPAPSAGMTASPAAVYPILLEDEDDTLSSIGIYEIGAAHLPDKLVTRLEVLSPANKPGRSYYRQYMAKRLIGLHAGVALVEIDLLHEQPPILVGIPSYAEGEAGAFPYLILVTQPYPTPQQGATALYGIGVLEALPTIPLPLSAAMTTTLDLGTIYERVFAGSRFLQRLVDYGQLPAQFDRYNAADRAAVRRQIDAIAQAR